jgi:hypothetical protein
MGEITEWPSGVRSILTWVVPPALTVASLVAGYESVIRAHESARLACESAKLAGQNVGRCDRAFSDEAMNSLIVLALTLLGCVICFLLPRSALVTAAGQVGALVFHTGFYFHWSASPLAGVLLMVTAPAALGCAACGLIAYLRDRRRRTFAALMAATMRDEAPEVA